MNVSFKIYWNNPIEMQTEASQGWIAQDRIEVEVYGTGLPTIVAASGVTIRVAGGQFSSYTAV